MIEELSVRGLAVVEKADIAFGPGLNAITGETGAGKSVLLSAIGLLTGQRADRSEVRAGEAQADVRARLALPPAVLETIAPILEEAGLEEWRLVEPELGLFGDLAELPHAKGRIGQLYSEIPG